MSNSPTILIIEDDPVFRRVLSFTVAKAGLAVETASNGQLGFDRLIQGGIDFLVTDYQMPVCSGLELLEQLAAQTDFQRPNAILCTAKGLELDSERLQREFDLVDIMHKPFSPRKLTELIVKNLNSTAPARSNQNQPTQAQPNSIHSPAQPLGTFPPLTVTNDYGANQSPGANQSLGARGQ